VRNGDAGVAATSRQGVVRLHNMPIETTVLRAAAPRKNHATF
jgi:hypothetical protein